MPRKNSRSRLAFNIPLLIFSIFIASLGVFTYFRLRPVSPTEIFLIEPVSLSEGHVVLIGNVVKDAPLEEPGNYLLVLSDSQAILLLGDNLDSFVGSAVTVEGDLTPPTNPTDLPAMTITEMETN